MTCYCRKLAIYIVNSKYVIRIRRHLLQTEGNKNKIRIARRASWNCNSQFSRRKSQVDDVSSETAFLTVNSKYVYRYTAPFLQTQSKRRNSGLLVERLGIFFLTILQMPHTGRRGVIVGNLQSRPQTAHKLQVYSAILTNRRLEEGF